MVGRGEEWASVTEDDRHRSSFADLRNGLSLFGEGLGFLRRESRLWPLAMVPILFATLLVALDVSIFWARFDSIHAAWISLLPVLEATSWWTWLWVGPGKALFWLVGWLGVLAAFALSLVAALLLANLLSAPFLDLLSQRVEAIARGALPSQRESWSSVLRETLQSFVAELQRLVFLASIWIGLSFVGFVIPGAQLLTGPLLVAVTIALLPLDYAGFALDRRRIPFRVRRRWLRDHLPMMLSFGGVAFVACLVPGLNLLITPVLVTAGTLLVLRVEPDRGPSCRGF